MVDHSTGQRVGAAIVLVEQRDADGIDRVITSTTTAPDGSFVAGNLPVGKYDVVIDASAASGSGATLTYAATVTFGTPTNAVLDKVPLVPEYGDSMPNGSPVDIGAGATVTTAGSSGVPVPAEIKLSTLLTQITIPTFAGSTPDITTTTSASCPSGTACASYKLLVPASNPVTGTYNPAGTDYIIPGQQQEVIYSVEGKAFVPGSAGTPDCMPSTQTAGPAVPRGTLAWHITNLNFTGCQ